MFQKETQWAPNIVATSRRAGQMSATDKVKLDALPTVTSVASPLTLVAGVLDVQPSSGTLEGSMSSADYTKLAGIATAAQVNVLEGVTGTAPIVAGAIAAKSQAISITAATTGAAGSMSAADKTKLDNLPTITSIATPLTLSAGALDIQAATAAQEGSMSAAYAAKVDQLTTDSGWQTPTLATNWTDYDTGNASVQYKKDALGNIVIKGLAKKSVALAYSDTIFTLPVGYRPTKQQLFASVGNDAFASIGITTAGVVALRAGGSATWTSLAGIIFDPAT